MFFSGTMESITNLNEELHTLMGFIPSQKVNRFHRSGKLLEMRKPTVACRLIGLSMIFRLHTHYSRRAINQPPSKRVRGKEILYD